MFADLYSLKEHLISDGNVTILKYELRKLYIIVFFFLLLLRTECIISADNQHFRLAMKVCVIKKCIRVILHMQLLS